MKLIDFLDVLNAYDYYLYDFDGYVIYDIYSGEIYEQFLNDYENKKRSPHLNRIIKEVIFKNDTVNIYLQKEKE